MKFVFVFSIIFLSACTSVQQQSQSNVDLWTYRADMQLSFDGGATVYDGITSAKINATLPITFISPVNIDRVQLTTCGRQAVCQSGGYCDSNYVITKSWTGEQQNKFTYNYSPTPEEAKGMCPIYVEAYSKQALASWGFIGVIGDETLPSTIYCNGKYKPNAGLTVCQALAGNENNMSFKVPVKFAAEKGCGLTTTDNMNFLVKPTAGVCRATFVDQAKEWQRLIMIAYKGVLVRVN